MQVGPDAGAVLLGKRFISYAFLQQWFKIGGDGQDTNHMSGVFNFTYLFANGWTVGTQPTLSVNWEALEGRAWDVWPRAAGGQDVQVRRPAHVVPSAGSGLPDPSERRRSDLEHSAASDANDSGVAQESAVLTRGPLAR